MSAEAHSDTQSTEPGLLEGIAGWRLNPGADAEEQIEALLEPLLAAGQLPDGHRSITAVLLGGQYHLGGEKDTRRMAQAVGLTATDRVVDLACYVGAPARQLAREWGCHVVGVDISRLHAAVAQRLSEVTGLAGYTRFICASADAVPEPDGSFTVAWSQCSFPTDLSWMPEIARLLASGGRLAFTGLIRRCASRDPDLLALDEIRSRIERLGFRVVIAEDISDRDLDDGWLPARRKLDKSRDHYRTLMGDEWLREAYRSLDADIAAWREGVTGNGRIVAMKE